MSGILRPVLYARDTSGGVRTWRIETDGSRYRTLSGLQDGKQAESGWTQCETKNPGKKNERLPEAQCQFEVEAAYTKKLKMGYFEDVADIDTGNTVFPMLALPYKDLKKGLDFTNEKYFAQRKFDGIRNLARDIGNFSRTGEVTATFPNVTEVLKEISREYRGIVLDGELYNHAYAEDLPKINSLVRKKDPSAEDIEKAQGLLQYHVYDLYWGDSPDMPFEARLDLLDEIFDVYGLDDHPSFAWVDTIPVRDQAQLDALYDQWRIESYEGQIIRTASGVYQIDKRPKDLVKRKERIDAEFVVEDILEGNGNWAGAAKSVIYRNPKKEGDTFSTGLAGDFEYAAQVLREKTKYIGGDGTIEFFKYSPYGVPIQGVTKLLHGGKRAA
ncbi:hypothetical protein [Sinorhizobium meliloti]|uniref:ATP-dependent DNA ligase n=1 Tax=Rhizobium meliloti TaxID=382 RepID=UPI001296C345|nr:hypothetical protein [Sinorhizobium meliloti]MDW9491695.1 hypothetical protein [Sinorhizobium meliloti]MQV02961.1 hypothetical protein [Sinorhizobium meliloti]